MIFSPHMKRRWLLIGCLFLIGWMSIGMQNNHSLVETTNNDYYHAREVWVDSVYNIMTIEEKIGQFFMIPVHPEKGLEAKKKYLDLIHQHKVGGLIYFKSHPTTVKNWTKEFQDTAYIPLLIAIDGEWGLNMRLDSTIKWPKQLTLGAIQDDHLIVEMGKAIAKECRNLGININFAPVVDVNNNPKNPVINYRSFGEDKFNVALKGMAYASGMQQEGVMAVAKHFPGHGDTDKDSHHTLPVINHSLERLNSVEMYPFKTMVNEGVQGIMAAHLFIPALDSTANRATSLSRQVLTDLLKDSLGFQGLIFSDALNMKGVSGYNDPVELYLQAFKAGNDILVYTEKTPEGIARIKEALYAGEISERELITRLKNVLNYKYDLTIGNRKTQPKGRLKLKPTSSHILLKQLYEAAITLVSDSNNLVPLSRNHKNIATVSLGISGIQNWQKNLEAYYNLDNYNNGALSTLEQNLSKKDLVIIGLHGVSWWPSKRYGLTENQVDFVNSLSKKTNVVLVMFGTPYATKFFDRSASIIVANEDNLLVQDAVISALAGINPINGKMPVSSGKFEVQEGLDRNAKKDVLEFGNPEEVRIYKNNLNGINSYLNRVVSKKASPGGQLIVAKDGKVVFHKNYGYQTYSNKIGVKVNHIYDVASLTKVAATTLSIMKLYEEGQISLEGTIGDYLQEYNTADLADVKIKDILIHQSGLPGWIPFYNKTLADTFNTEYYSKTPISDRTMQVADSLHMFIHKDTLIWNNILRTPVKNNPKYRYSDIGFYLLFKIIERITEMPFEVYVQQMFYEPMGLHNTTFKPLEKFNINYIVPTEEDKIWRDQLLRGHVHDMGAAMLGGVCGHAGLFSNAFDLAAIMQMLLNGGYYNNQKFLKEETIKLFTSQQQQDNRRGLGFDKPVVERDGTGPTSAYCSLQTFGHTGFTGTAAWADPKYNLVYVFISNRVHPNMNNKTLIKENFRTDIQDLIYMSLMDYYNPIEIE